MQPRVGERQKFCGAKFPKEDNLFLPSPYGLHRRDYQYRQLVYKRYKYLHVVVTRKRKRRLSTSEPIDQQEKRK